MFYTKLLSFGQKTLFQLQYMKKEIFPFFRSFRLSSPNCTHNNNGRRKYDFLRSFTLCMFSLFLRSNFISIHDFPFFVVQSRCRLTYVRHLQWRPFATVFESETECTLTSPAIKTAKNHSYSTKFSLSPPLHGSKRVFYHSFAHSYPFWNFNDVVSLFIFQSFFCCLHSFRLRGHWYTECFFRRCFGCRWNAMAKTFVTVSNKYHLCVYFWRRKKQLGDSAVTIAISSEWSPCLRVAQTKKMACETCSDTNIFW